MMILSIITQNTDNTPCITLYAGVSSWQGRGKSIRSFPLEPRLVLCSGLMTQRIFLSDIDHDMGPWLIMIQVTWIWGSHQQFVDILRYLGTLSGSPASVSLSSTIIISSNTLHTQIIRRWIFIRSLDIVFTVFAPFFFVTPEKSLIKIVTNSTLFCVTICVK